MANARELVAPWNLGVVGAVLNSKVFFLQSGFQPTYHQFLRAPPAVFMPILQSYAPKAKSKSGIVRRGRNTIAADESQLLTRVTFKWQSLAEKIGSDHWVDHQYLMGKSAIAAWWLVVFTGKGTATLIKRHCYLEEVSDHRQVRQTAKHRLGMRDESESRATWKERPW